MAAVSALTPLAPVTGSPPSSCASSPTFMRRMARVHVDSRSSSPEPEPTGMLPSPSASPKGKRKAVSFECAICTCPVEDPCVGGGCAHHFCFDCMTQWANKASTCPTCRAPIYSIVRDPEFATLVGAICKASEGSGTDRGLSAFEGKGKTLRISHPAGLVLTSTPGVTGCKVVKAATGNGAAAAGIRARDTVLAVNGTPVSDHKVAVKLIEASSLAGDALVTIAASRTTLRFRSPSRLARFSRSPPQRREDDEPSD